MQPPPRDHAVRRAPALRDRPRRRAHPGIPAWARTGLVLACAFCLWLVMDATVLQHNAQVNSPVGARRTAALDVLGPIAAVARALHLDLPVAKAEAALGRTPVGGFAIPTVPTTVPIATTTTIPLLPTPAHPLRVLIIGDSLSLDLGGPLQEDLSQTGEGVGWSVGVVSSGLTRPDFYNWIAALRYDIYHYRPSVIVGMMGANDAQAFVVPRTIDFGTVAWRRQYLANCDQLFSLGRKDGRKFIWVSLPTIANRGLNAQDQVVRDLQAEAARRYGVVYFDSDAILTVHGRYVTYLKVGGELTAVRTADGIHLTAAGGALLAQSVLDAIEVHFHVRFT